MTPGLDDVAWPVQTFRLTIRPAGFADAEKTWTYRRIPSVSQWLPNIPRDLEEHREWFGDPGRLAKTLIIELNGEVIGDLMLSVQDAWAQSEIKDQARGVEAELGWCLSPEHGGHGYATEAVQDLIRLCFDELGLRRVKADCFADNEASWRLMERVGMRRELHTIRESLHRSGDWLDGFGYALLAEEWQRQAERRRGDT